MNIFVLDRDPKLAAQQHLDKHVVKMILEYAQLLSTAHRMLDGKPIKLAYREPVFSIVNGEYKLIGHKDKVKATRELPGEKAHIVESLTWSNDGVPTFKAYVDFHNRKCYNFSHQNHPCAIWARETTANYDWLYELFKETSAEFTYRYGGEHKTWLDNRVFLQSRPRNIKIGPLTPFAQAMAEEYKAHDPVTAYQNYYVGAKAPFAFWTRRPVPTFFKERIVGYDDATHQRTSR